MSSKRLHAYVYLLLVAMIWGAAGSVIKFTLNGIDPLPFLTYRFGISLLAIIVLIILGFNHFPKNPKIFLQSFIYGVLTSTVALGLLFMGVDRTSVLDMSLITSIGPLMVTFAGSAYLHERVTKREKIGLAIAFVGTLITILGPGVNGNQETRIIGNLLVFSYLIVYTITAVMAKKLTRKGVSPITLSNFTFIAGFITMLPIALYLNGPISLLGQITSLQPQFHLGVFYMAIISGNIAFALWPAGQKSIEISEASLFSYLLPVFGVPVAVFWLHEEISLKFIIGAVIIGTGVVIAEFKKTKNRP